ncbi:MAG TPA: hypothetical protein VMF57_16290 [Solirubrobacteraceae bacterium]|nr:hypothetical protein [Solirubrobacteraceae bacterium]
MAWVLGTGVPLLGLLVVGAAGVARPSVHTRALAEAVLFLAAVAWVAGNVGAEHRFEYTVIGDPVNEAARLAELAKRRPGRTLASDAALDRAPQAENDGWRVGETAVLRGRTKPTRLGQAVPRAS